MKKVYFLKTCDTCKRILNDLNLDDFEQREIKSNPITEEELAEMYTLSNSYEELFNKRARLYKSMDLKNKSLSEEDYKNYLLEEYTFLKRPVFIIDDEIFIGNSKKTVEKAKEKIG